MKTFEDFNISKSALAILAHNGIHEPTPVQEATIPVVRSGQDAIVQSPTGTGKTLAFLLPVFERIKPSVDLVQALVVTPTRELAIQIAKVALSLGKAFDVRTLAIYGGQDIERQKQKLGHNPQLIIGTPGRLLDHLRHRTLLLSTANKIIIDEADEMLKLGFIEDVEVLLAALAADRQVVLFSATIPERVRKLAQRFMVKPQEIAIKSNNITLDTIEQTVVNTSEETKLDKLCELINTYQPYLAMVFCRTKQRAYAITMALAGRGYLVEALHGDLTQTQRALVMKRFSEAKIQILVATDIVARGIDVDGVTHVFNYDIPQNTEEYIHRIGRTGRAGREGVAVTFVNARQYEQLRRIEAGIKKRIDKQRSSRRQEKARPQKPIVDKTIHDEKENRQTKAKSFSRHASSKGLSHKGHGFGSHRNSSAKPKGTFQKRNFHR